MKDSSAIEEWSYPLEGTDDSDEGREGWGTLLNAVEEALEDLFGNFGIPLRQAVDGLAVAMCDEEFNTPHVFLSILDQVF